MARFITGLCILATALYFGAWLLSRRPPAPTSSFPADNARIVTPKSTFPGQPPAERPEPAEPVDAGPPPELDHPLTDALCSEGMVLIDGLKCAGARQDCVEETSTGCARYETHCRNERQPLRFCIDRYEFPNQRGVRPAIMVTFEQAERACRNERKRLCTEDEWTFACEGIGVTPFPYGADRRDDACNVGPSGRQAPVEAFWNPKSVSALVTRYDRRVPSGERPRCVSSFGVYDLTGNVSEWVTNTADPRYASALKGGDFTSAALNCRATRALRTRFYRSFPVGFRCCADPLVSPSGPRPASGAQASGENSGPRRALR